jgi:hypothetical protein
VGKDRVSNNLSNSLPKTNGTPNSTNPNVGKELDEGTGHSRFLVCSLSLSLSFAYYYYTQVLHESLLGSVVISAPKRSYNLACAS